MSKRKTAKEQIEIDARKRAIRSEMRTRRRQADPEWIIKASDRIQQTVIELPAFKTTSSIGCYLALPNEVQTQKIIEGAWYGNKRVCVPAWNDERKHYELAWLGREDPTRHGRWDIREPARGDLAAPMDVDVIIVPALAYDRQGDRLGHGGGHYDRILGAWSGLKIGVAFSFQVHDKIPVGSQDMPVDVIVTESGSFEAGSAN